MEILELAMSMGAGGAETHVLTLSHALTRAGHSVTIASSGGILVPEAERAGITHKYLPLSSRSPAAFLRSVAGVVSLCRHTKFDVIHAHGRIPALAAHAAGLVTPQVPPCTVTVHGIYDPKARGARFSFWGDGTVAVSRDVADYTAKIYHVPRDRIDVIPNGVNIPDKERVETPRGLDIVTAGRLDADSSAAAFTLLRVFPLICREFAEMTPTLTVMGGGSREKQIRARADEINRELGREAVKAVGAVPDAAARMAEHGIFVGSSRAAIEAMAAGVPVILCGNAGVRGLLTKENFAAAAEDNLTCRTAPRTADADGAMLDGLRRFARMSDKDRAGLGVFCRRCAEDNYDICTVAEATAAVLEKTVRRARPGIAMCGYYGAGNIGDDASLAVMADRFGRDAQDGRITAISKGPKKEGIPENISVITAFRPIKTERELARCRVAVLGGGSLLQDATSLRSLAYYAWVMRTAHKAGCRTVIIGGVGPLTSRTARRIAACTVRRATAVFARDNAAAAEFRALGAARTVNAADPAVLTLPKEPACKPDGRYFVVCPRGVAALRRKTDAENGEKRVKKIGKKAENTLFDAITEAARRLAADTGMIPVFAAMAPEDSAICREMAEKAGCGAMCIPAGKQDAGQTVALAAGADLVVAVRLHAAVFAFAAGTPAVVVDHDPKTAGFAADVGLPPLPIDGITADAILNAIKMCRVPDAAARVEMMKKADSALRAASRPETPEGRKK